MNVREPKYTKAGTYHIRGRVDALAVAVAALRNVCACSTAYHARGPEMVADNMLRTAQDALRAIAGAP